MSQFFSPTVVETMSGEFGQSLLAPKISDVTVIFCDVRGFSRMTEDSAVDLFPLLNRVSAALGTIGSLLSVWLKEPRGSQRTAAPPWARGRA